jgi:hypothetical protein
VLLLAAMSGYVIMSPTIRCRWLISLMRRPKVKLRHNSEELDKLQKKFVANRARQELQGSNRRFEAGEFTIELVRAADDPQEGEPLVQRTERETAAREVLVYLGEPGSQSDAARLCRPSIWRTWARLNSIGRRHGRKNCGPFPRRRWCMSDVRNPIGLQSTSIAKSNLFPSTSLHRAADLIEIRVNYLI